jgi:deoxyguanosine kinase
LFFLFERSRQVQELRQSELFGEFRITDFMIEKDRIFAETNLDADELNLYDNICNHLDIAPLTPDLVIYLQAPAEILIDRISQRGENSIISMWIIWDNLLTLTPASFTTMTNQRW